jgi:thymidylate synthase (FAD)
MKLIESKVEYLPQNEGLEGVYKQIEKCGRVSYKSEDKITEDSAEPFVKRMIDSHHGAVLEHGTIYLDYKIIPVNNAQKNKILEEGAYSLYGKNDYEPHVVVALLYYLNFDCSPYSKVTLVEAEDNYPHVYITTNMRVLEDRELTDALKHLCSPTEFHEKRYTFKFTCSRAIANELIRHRAFSFMQESQRFVNYSKEKFGNEITFIKPSWVKDAAFDVNIHLYNALYAAEVSYFDLLNNGAAPQQARDVLPNATKTELIMTGFSSDWRYLLDLRLFEKTGAVHPDMLDLMKKLQNVAEEAGVWDDIMKHKSKFD